MEDIRRFSLMQKIGTLDFITVITDKDKYAKVPDGYERCGKSFLGEYHLIMSRTGTYIYQ